jgi:Flp pilus assembly protein TadG
MSDECVRVEERRDCGAIIVEFALIVPILVILLVGIIEFGRAYNTQIALQGAAREGARALALRQDAAAAVNASRGEVVMTVSATRGCPIGDNQSFAQVTTSTNFTFGIPFVPIGTKTLNATAAMRCGL